MSQPIALVTGASGFIGSCLVNRLVLMGWKVSVVLRHQPDVQLLEQLKSANIFLHDGSTEGMIKIVQKSNPDIVFHLASLFLAQHTSNDISALVRSNIEFSTQLAEALKVNNVPYLINTGTSWQNYEDASYNPVCLYAALKEAFEAILRFYVETSTLKVITLKLFDTYGPTDSRPKLLHLFKRIALSGESLEMSPGDQLIDLVFIDDVIDAFIVAFERLRAGQVHNIEHYAVSSGSPISLKKLAAIFTAVSGLNLEIVWGGRPYREREVMIPWTNYKILPEWSPKIDLERGVCLSLANILARKA